MTDFLPPDPEMVEMIRAALPNAKTLAAISDSYAGRVESVESIAEILAESGECPRCGPKAIEQARRIIEAMDAED